MWTRFVSPSSFVFALVCFCLPWIEIRCDRPRGGPFAGQGSDVILTTQSGLEMTYGGFTSTVNGEPPEEEEQLAIDRQKRQCDATAPAMRLYALCLVAGLAASLTVRDRNYRLLLAGSAGLAAIVVLLLQRAIGFPILEDVSRAVYGKYTIWFWLGLASTAAALPASVASRLIPSKRATEAALHKRVGTEAVEPDGRVSKFLRFLCRPWVEIVFLASAYAVWHFMPVFGHLIMPPSPRVTLSGVWFLGFSKDSSIVAAQDRDGTPRFWDVCTAEELSGESRSRLGTVGGFDSRWFSPDGRYCVTATKRDETWSAEKRCAVWEVPTGKQVALLKDVGFSFSRWDLWLEPPEPDKESMPIVFFSADSRTLIYGHTLWDLAKRQVRCTLKADKDMFCGLLAVSPRGEVFATFEGEGPVRSYDVEGASWFVRFWNGNTGERLATSPGMRNWIPRSISNGKSIVQNLRDIRWSAFSPDGRWLLCWGHNEYTDFVNRRLPPPRDWLTFFDVATGSEICTVDMEENPFPIGSITFNAPSATMKTGPVLGGGRLWDVSSLPPRELLSAAEQFAVSPDGTLVASLGQNEPIVRDVPRFGKRLIEVFAIPSLQRIRGVPIPKDTNRVQFLPDNRTLLLETVHFHFETGHPRCCATLALRDAVTGGRQRTLLSRDGFVAFNAVSPDGKTVAAIAEDDGEKVLELWDCPPREPLLAMAGLWCALLVGYAFVRRRAALRLLRRDAGHIKYRTGQEEGSEHQ